MGIFNRAVNSSFESGCFASNTRCSFIANRFVLYVLVSVPFMFSHINSI